jgi:hypothetical protein
VGVAKKLEQQLKCHSFRMPFLCFIRILSNAAQFERGDYCVISGGGGLKVRTTIKVSFFQNAFFMFYPHLIKYCVV